MRELDGIRAIAIALVLLTHLFASASIVPGSYLAALPAPVSAVITHGWLGVDLFFVLSGFLITGILLRAKGRSDYFRSFYIRRILRIFPLYYSVVFVLMAIYGYANYGTFWNFALALSANLPGLVHAAAPQAAGPLWSLAVEEQFYLFWPLVVLALSRRWLTVFALSIVIAEPLARFALGNQHLLYPWCRFDGLALGALLAIRLSAPEATRAGMRLAGILAAASVAVVAVAAPFGGFSEGTVSSATRISEAILLFGAVIATVVACPGLRLTAILRSPAARIVAEWSFCLYLVHVPLVGLFDYIAHGVPAIGSLDPALLVPLRAVTVVAAACVVAAFTRRFIELPFLRLKGVLTPETAGAGAVPASPPPVRHVGLPMSAESGTSPAGR